MHFPKADFPNLSIVEKDDSNTQHSATIGRDDLKLRTKTALWKFLILL
ncbi:hypothetical protein LEP1GSC084_1297 [Leptospira interrogans serovar Medanensis str. L0448]|nr:hypothetical protein LEP1GSC099_0992 [Leptospira interrogans str. UI 08452]EMN34021.1 hypothetical protein LEP1GSC084_1963 [Leptospira interrogans serovar Medanensis str. L0448]EKR82784.1 hypothetical protein LEP1GSC099_4371 [Leptospira interrogans str. UI 08452]EKR85110.1 hypothetical protein LEP1GSC099_4591 [Leptospira interrogans str. UI 08452]EMN34186.1 hypothetical protein LEP1GSC084_0321 [Leptospira interrogans serovar Medanensis str. L0448]